MAKSAMFSLWLNVIVYLGILGLHVSHPQPVVPALYIFGDSTADVGTNNYLPESRARADFPYNGIDFPISLIGKFGKATGRFSNGYNTVDFIARLLGFYESPPPFLSFSDSNISEFLIRTVPTKGINFASGGSGLLHHTGQHKWGKVISFGEQVQQFASVRSNISELLGTNAVANISKSLFIISVGNNDFFEHFDSNFTGTNRSYITTLISSYEAHLRYLYELGARKFGIISVGAVGCCPIHRTYLGDCYEAMNVDAQLFYTALRGLLRKLGSECKGFKYALGNAYELSKSIVDHAGKLVFTELRKACCGKGMWKASEPCRPDSDLCKDRKTYLFWDQYHPTETAAQLTAYALILGTKPQVEPMSFAKLALSP